MDFSRLRQEAGLELLDAATEFSTPMSKVSLWETGVESPPQNVINSLIGIGRITCRLPTPDQASAAIESICNTLFEGDCLKILDQIPDGSVNLILCDLPYGTTQNRWDSVIDLNRLWSQYKRILAPKGAIVLTSQGIFTARLILSNDAWFKYKIVWEKSKSTNFLNAKKQPLRKHEDICVFYDRPATYNPQMTPGLPYDKGVRRISSLAVTATFCPSM